MLKLNKRKIRWIVREVDKRNLSIYQIARIQKITPRHVRRIHKRFNGVDNPVLKPCGSKPKRITEEEKKIVIDSYNGLHMGAVRLGSVLKERGIHISHNKNM